MKRLLLLTAIFLTACSPSQDEREDSSSAEPVQQESNLFTGKIYLECSSKNNQPIVYVELSEADKSGFVYLKNMDFNADNNSIGLEVTDWSESSISLWGYTWVGGLRASAQVFAALRMQMNMDYDYDSYSWKPTNEEKARWIVNRVKGTITAEDKIFEPKSLRNYRGDCKSLPPNVGYGAIQKNIAALEAFKEKKKKDEEELKAQKDALTKLKRKF